MTLINSILDFSKIEDGKMEIVPVRYETANLIDDLVNMISEKARKKSLVFQTAIDPNLPKSLYGDDVRIRQIITNILTNAVKYTHEGSITLSMSGKEIDADTLNLQVTVSDTGIGIRAEDMGKLFQSFQRIDEERNRNIEGTGLGIAIVQKLLAMMDSKLEVASVYGKGSEFSFTLIQKIIDHTPVGNYDERKQIHSDTTTDKKFLTAAGAKILAVDDNDMNLKVIRGLLKRNEIVPELADSGTKCIELAKKNFYHIIFLDNMMPVMSGIETLKILRREKILSDKTKVVMLTASAIAGMREIYLREGFDDYLSKPIDVAALETILERHLPAEIVSFKTEESAIDEPPAAVDKSATEPATELATEPVIKSETETEADDDTFTERDRKIFAETCPTINLDTALEYCMDSKEFLIQMLETFCEDEKSDKIQAAFDSRDVKNYQVLVHGLKSTSLLIGAEDLSERAKKLELAANGDLMTTYKTVREQIAEYLSERR